jgi:hypothetical protein
MNTDKFAWTKVALQLLGKKAIEACVFPPDRRRRFARNAEPHGLLLAFT